MTSDVRKVKSNLIAACNLGVAVGAGNVDGLARVGVKV